MSVFEILRTYDNKGRKALIREALAEAVEDAVCFGPENKQRKITITVAPVLNYVPFPVDMLRTDRLWPRTKRDAKSIERSLLKAGGDERQPGTLIKLTLEYEYPSARSPRALLSIDTWESYSWVALPKHIVEEINSAKEAARG